MSEHWHPQNGILAPILGVSALLEEWLSINDRVILLATDDLRRWQLGGLSANPRARIVGQSGELLTQLAAGVAATGSHAAMIAPVDQLRGTLAPGALAIAVSDSGWGEAELKADYSLLPADVHQASAMLKWSFKRLSEGESILIHAHSRPVPLIWAPTTVYDPDRWVTVGSGSTLVLAVGSAMASVRQVMESGVDSVRAVSINETDPDEASRKAVRALTVGTNRIVVVRPPGSGDWIIELLADIKKPAVECVLKPDWRGAIDYTSSDHQSSVANAIKKAAR